MSTEPKNPRHRAIEADLRRKITMGEMSVGQMLPGRRDLAKQYGVSTLTVERAVDGLVREGLLRSDDRRGTFVAAAAPQSQARPRIATDFTVGVVARLFLPHQDRGFGNNTWVREIVQGAEHELSGEKHITIFTNTVDPDGSIRSLRSAVDSALQAPIDGLLIVAIDNSPEDIADAQEFLETRTVPSVFVASSELPRRGVQTFPDAYDAGYQAAQHLIRQGCDEIAYISPFRAWWAEQRGQGIAAACSSLGLPPEKLRVFPSGPKTDWTAHPETYRLGEKTAREAFAAIGPRTGVIGASDEITIGIFRAMSDLGKRAGHDCLVVSFDDIPQARDLHLTSLRPPWDSLGHEGARLLRNALSGSDESLQVRLRWRLIPRGSSRWQGE